MKWIYSTLFVLTCSVYVSCNNDGPKTGGGQIPDTANYTSIQWLDSMVSFGSINMGEKAMVTFKFRNTGNKPLFLTNVKAGCGCTVPDFTKGAIAPGSEGKVTGAFNSNQSQPGEVRKNIFVTTNTKNRTDHTLIFTGVIRKKNPANNQ